MLDRLLDLFRTAPFANWPEQRPQRLTLDLSRHALNGVRLGDPVASLRGFGKPSDPRRPGDRYFYYHAIGCEIGADVDRQVDYFGVIIAPVADEPNGAGEIDLIFPDGIGIKVDDRTVLQTFADRLGPPTRKDEDADELLWIYLSHEHSFEIEAAPDQRVRRLNLFPV